MSNRNYEKFFTPTEIADYMVRLAGIKEGDEVLEPHAGNGRIIGSILRLAPKCNITAVEKEEKYILGLTAIARYVYNRDFLDIPLSLHQFDICIANPPFGNGVDLMAHFDKICDLIKFVGKIIMIVPEDFDPQSKHLVHPIINWAKNSDGSITPIKIIEL